MLLDNINHTIARELQVRTAQVDAAVQLQIGRAHV